MPKFISTAHWFCDSAFMVLWKALLVFSNTYQHAKAPPYYTATTRKFYK